MKVTSATPQYSFEEYRLLYESTVHITDARIATNRWNYSVSVAIIAAEAVLINHSLEEPESMFVALTAAALLAGLAIMFCVFWIGQISDYKLLNKAKFEVLAEMAPKVRFPDLPSAVSFAPFQKEWERLQKDKGLISVNARGKKIEALGSSGTEYFLPRAICFLLIAVLFYSILIGLLNWDSYIDSASFHPGNRVPTPSASP